jgi:hypothetical protein
VDSGGDGKLLSILADADAETIELNTTSRKPLQDTAEFCTVYLDGEPFKTVGISGEQQEIRWQVENPDPGRRTEVTFRYHYTRREPVNLTGNKAIPFDLQVVSGGRDPNRFHVGINGGLYHGEKGINLYHIDRRGLAVTHWHFNTSYFTEASDQLIKTLEKLSETEGYLLIAVRFDAARSLTTAAQETLKEFRLNTKPLARPFTKYIALLDLESGRVLAQRHHARRVALEAGVFDTEAGFSISELNIH